MYSKLGFLVVVAIGLIAFPGFAAASPPVPPPEEGFNIAIIGDYEMSGGDFSETEMFTWTWLADTRRKKGKIGRPISSTLAFPGRDQFLDFEHRAGQIRYTQEMQATDASFLQFKQGFTAASEGADTAGNNLSVEKNYGYVASDASLIANAENKERVGLSIVANGDFEGLGDMPSLCPWASENEIPATNEFIAMGSDTSTTSVMVSNTETKAAGTRAPELNHRISAVGVGTAQGLMRVSLFEGADQYFPGYTVDLVSKTDYSEKTQAVGTIEKFTKGMHYHSTIPQFQMPEPWYELQ